MILDVRLDAALGSELFATKFTLVLLDLHVNGLVDVKFTRGSKTFLTLLQGKDTCSHIFQQRLAQKQRETLRYWTILLAA